MVRNDARPSGNIRDDYLIEESDRGHVLSTAICARLNREGSGGTMEGLHLGIGLYMLRKIGRNRCQHARCIIGNEVTIGGLGMMGKGTSSESSSYKVNCKCLS